MVPKSWPANPFRRWDIHPARAKATLLATVEAKDAEAAIAEAVKQFGRMFLLDVQMTAGLRRGRGC